MRTRLIQHIAVIIALTFLGSLLWKYFDEISKFHWKLNYFYLVLAILILSLLFFIGSWGWMLILHRLRVRISFKRSMEIWVASIIGKYIPGKVWFVLGRIYLGQKLGISKTKMSLSILLEIILMQSSGVMFFFASFLFWEQRTLLHQIWPFMIMFWVLTIVVMQPAVLQRIVNPLLRILKKKEISIDISNKDILLLLSFYFFFWFCSGIGVYFLTRSFYPINITAFPIISGSWAISTVLGFMVLVAPGGLGVREGVIVFLLSRFIPTYVALLVAISSRILLTILEIGFVGILLRFDVSLSKYYEEPNTARVSPIIS